MTKLKQNIGLLALTLYGVGDILGSGIYGLIGKAAGQMGHAVWLSFFVSMIAAGLTGLSYASIGSRYPRAGGAAYVSFRAFGLPFLSYLIGLAVLASGLTSMATAAKVFSGYFVGLGFDLPLLVVSIGFACLIAGLVFLGTSESLFANSICTLIELSGLLIVIAVGFSYVGNVNYLDATTAANPTGALNFNLILTGSVLTFYSFVGFEDILNVSEEVKDPKRTLPYGLLLAVGISSLIYMTISIVAVSVLDPVVLASSSKPLVDVVSAAAPWFPISIFGLIAMFAVSNTALLNFIMGSRMLYGMANQGLLPSLFSRIHSRRASPHISILTVLFAFLCLIISGDISSLAKATSVLLLGSFTVVNLSLFFLKQKESIAGAFEIPRFVPLLGSVICLTMLSYAKKEELLTAGIILILISLMYLIKRPSIEAVKNMQE